MRKADYTVLADIIYSARMGNHFGEASTCCTQHGDKILRELAITFTKHASVDKAEFLKACGIE